MQVTIYHNPRCSKSRQTLALLEQKGIAPTIVKYLDEPPSVAQLGRILELLKIAPRQLMRHKESDYASNDLANPELSDEQLIEAMHRCPKLIERPIVVVNDRRAAIGRPPENVLELFD